MSKLPEALGKLLGNLIWGAAVIAVAVVIPPAKPDEQEPGTLRPGTTPDPSWRRDLVYDEAWSVNRILADVPPDEPPPQEPAGYGNYQDGEIITCWDCGGQFRTNRWITCLVTYSLEPQYTHVRHRCPGDACASRTLTVRMNELALCAYLEAGYPIVKDGAIASTRIHEVFGNDDGSDLELWRASDVQVDIHAKALSGELDEDFAKLIRRQTPGEQSS